MCNISIETKRASKEIGSSLEANLTISLRKEMMKFVKGIDLSELCITSQAKVIESQKEDDIEVSTTKAEGNKCPVCWKISKNECERHQFGQR